MMASASTNLFWDSCVFRAFLSNETTKYDVNSIQQYLQEAAAGKYRIYASSLVLAEVLPNHILKPGIGSFEAFVSDFQGAVVIVDPSVNVMSRAGKFRALPYKKQKSDKRRLGTVDAIMLASCIFVSDVMGVKIDCFHTFDDGKSKRPEGGKEIPILSYQEWCDDFTEEQLSIAQTIIDIKRCKPIHPTPGLPGLSESAQHPREQ